MKIELTATEGLKVACAFRDTALEHGWTEDELAEANVIEEYASAFDAAMKAIGIKLVVNPNVVDDEDEYEDDEEFEDEDEDFSDDDDYDYEDEEEEEDEDDEEDEEDTCEYTLTVKGDFVLRYMNAGHSFEEACKIANILFGEGEGE